LEDAEHEAFEQLSLGDPAETYRAVLQFGRSVSETRGCGGSTLLPAELCCSYSNAVQRNKWMSRTLFPGVPFHEVVIFLRA